MQFAGEVVPFVMSLFWTVLLLLPVPAVDVEKKTTPLVVVVVTPLMILFLIEFDEVLLINRIVAPLVLVLEIVRSLKIPAV
jgi:hypothetical protein